MARTLNAADLDALADDGLRADDARPFLTELLEAVEQERLADPAEAGYALGLAAEMAARCGDPEQALALSSRAITAAQDGGSPDAVRAHHADLLLQYGRDDEAMRELSTVRPQLTRDPLAASYVIEPLLRYGRAELAEQWLTAALTTASERADHAEDADPGSDEAMDAWEIADALGRQRADVRHELGLPPDEADELAGVLDGLDDVEPDLLFWPAELFAGAREALGDDAVLGTTFDEHRAAIEQAFLAAAVDEPLLVEVAAPELLVADGGDVGVGPLLEWPPGRNDPCWCLSGVKYKKCCLPRGRT